MKWTGHVESGPCPAVATCVAFRGHRGYADTRGSEKSSGRTASAGAQTGYALLTTKLNVPSVRTGLVTRPRLFGRLDDGVKGKLTLVCAPAGFGKSTLLGDWILRSGIPVGWISLDEDDNEPSRFLSYLVAALQSAAPDIGKRASSLLDSPQPPSRPS